MALELLQFALGFTILAAVAYFSHLWTKTRVTDELGNDLANCRRVSMANTARLDRLVIENRTLRSRLNHANVQEPKLPEWLND